MSEDELFVLAMAGVAGFVGALLTASSRLHGLYTRGNLAIGLHRLVAPLTLLWTGYVMRFHGDASITGIYVLFYLVLAYAAVKVLGQLSVGWVTGISGFRHAFERRSLPAAVFTAGFALCTGLIAGACLWGEADPLSDDEGGWWIPVGFFLMGWELLAATTALYARRRQGRLRRQLLRELDFGAAGSSLVFMLATTTLIMQGVAGDFWGWTEGLASMGVIALMLIGHELISARAVAAEARGQKAPEGMDLIEQGLYIVLALVGWQLNRMISANLIAAGA